jgi:hypothetical protein
MRRQPPSLQEVSLALRLERWFVVPLTSRLCQIQAAIERMNFTEKLDHPARFCLGYDSISEESRKGLRVCGRRQAVERGLDRVL